MKNALRLSACLFCILTVACSTRPRPPLGEEHLGISPLPQPISGHFVGVSGGALLAIGGTSFPVPLFSGGRKVWHDAVQAVEFGREPWRTVFTLDHPLAYGGSVTTDEGVICLGGSDGSRHYAEVFRLRYENGRIAKTSLPSLPQPLAMMGAAKLGNTIYVAGGQTAPDATEALRAFWALDLSARDPQWRQLDPWPGDGRILPVVASQDGAVHVISGAALSPDAEGKAERRYLADGFAWRPATGWKRIADAPQPLVAAPAATIGPVHLLVFGGDDGANARRVQELKENHPGFSRRMTVYHTITNTWADAGDYALGLVTTTAVPWLNRIVIPGGEDRPGHRDGRVFEMAPTRSIGSFGWLDYAVLALYLAPNLLLGFYLSRRSKTTRDFFLGGGRIPWWAAGLSIYGTQLSAITYLAVPAKAYAEDLTYVIAHLCIIFVAPVVIYFYLPFFRRLNVTSAYEYLERRFNLAVRLFGSASFILLQAGRLAIVMLLPALALAAVSGLNVYASIFLMGVFCTIYTMKGGIEAVVWTDVIQSIVLLGGAVVALTVLVLGVDGGVGKILSLGWNDGKLHMFTWTGDYTTTAVWVVLFGNLLSVMIPYTTDQTVIQKYMTTRDEKQSVNAIWMNAWLTIPTSILFFGLGVALYAFYKTHPMRLNPTLQTDAIFAWFIAREMPPGLAGVVVAGIFAAAMSTLSSSMNSIATAVVTDFYARLRPAAADATRLALARRVTVVMGLLGTGAALLMATVEIKSLWDLFLQILGLFGGALAGVFALGIFTRRAHGAGALVGIVVSAAVLFAVQRHTRVHFFLYGAIGICTCIATGYLASLLLPAAPRPLHGLTIHRE